MQLTALSAASCTRFCPAAEFAASLTTSCRSIDLGHICRNRDSPATMLDTSDRTVLKVEDHMPYLALLVMLLWVFCLIDVITADDGGVRFLPKIVWLLLVVFLPLAGSLAWLFAGRPVGGGVWGGPGGGNRRASNSAFPEYETRPGRQSAQNPDADAEFLRRCRERAEEQRRLERERRKRDLGF